MFLLGAASLGYRLVVYIRNALYDHHILRTHRVNAIVLSVGNLTTGGTGKTPLVVWLCQTITQNSKLKTQNCHVAILTRGYKATTQNSKLKTQNYSDEPAELVNACPGVPIIVNPDRVAGAAEAIRRGEGFLKTEDGRQRTEGRGKRTEPSSIVCHPSSEIRPLVLVMDDGFQHRRLARDLDIVTIDATEPFGYGRLLPAGLLREPLTSLRRAHAVVLTRCDQVAPSTLDEIEAAIHRVNPNLPIARSIHAPAAVRFVCSDAVRRSLECPYGHTTSEISPAQLRDKTVFAFCGLGNPCGFLRTVESCGCRLVGQRVFNDHQAYTGRILADLHAEAQSKGAELLLTTQKDWTKIKSLNLLSTPPALAYLVVELQFTTGGETLTALIDRTLADRMAASKVKM